jgi:hypothetical protein
MGTAVPMWATPTAAEGQRGSDPIRNRGPGPPLNGQAATWPTPQARDHKGGFTGHRNGGKDLAEAVQNWPTPRAADAKGDVYQRDTSGRVWPSLLGLARGLPAPETDPDGNDGSPKRVLNPPFVEMLMGWPRGWTDCTRSATESYRSWRQQHSSVLRAALGSLGGRE